MQINSEFDSVVNIPAAQKYNWTIAEWGAVPGHSQSESVIATPQQQ